VGVFVCHLRTRSFSKIIWCRWWIKKYWWVFMERPRQDKYAVLGENCPAVTLSTKIPHEIACGRNRTFEIKCCRRTA